MRDQNPLDITAAVVLSLDNKTENNLFPTKVAKQRALDSINRGYDKLIKMIQDKILSIPYYVRNPKKTTTLSNEINNMYYALPHYPHLWRENHSDLLDSSFPDEVEAIQYLLELRQGVKDTDVKGGK